MKAMILAAGRGERMGALTTHTPKCLLKVGGRYLIEYTLDTLKKANIHDIVINISWQREQVKQVLGNGEKYDVRIQYSEEPERLETGGGIVQALPLLGDAPFIVISSDIITHFPLATLPIFPDGLAHIVMVNNPPYHPQGDYGLHAGKVLLTADEKFNLGGMGVYSPELFAGSKIEYFRLTSVLNPAIAAGKVTGEIYQGCWHNIGTPEDIKIFESDVMSLQG
jgi:N-acetyl-alpha-D-muramate 1-phosphate uridylyltransferase